MLNLSRAADLYRARLEHAHARGDRHRRLPGQAFAGRTLPDVSAQRTLDPSERRVLSRWTVRHVARRDRTLQHVLRYGFERTAEGGPRRVSEVALSNSSVSRLTRAVG